MSLVELFVRRIRTSDSNIGLLTDEMERGLRNRFIVDSEWRMSPFNVFKMLDFNWEKQSSEWSNRYNTSNPPQF